MFLRGEAFIMETVLEVVLGAVLDSLKMLPFLFGAYLLLEFLEHKTSGKLARCLQKMGVFGSLGGSVLGCVPQCGFSVAASNLYAGRLISLGTLMAVFLSTSDEALPILVSHPESVGVIWKLLIIKVIIAAASGILIDLLLVKSVSKNQKEDPICHDLCEHCDCEHRGVFASAVFHTVQIFVFILIVNLVMTALVTLIGEGAFYGVIGKTAVFQPFLAGLIGLIPNCAASVVLTEFYIKGGITFGSLIAGLSTGAGLGLVVLFRTNRPMKQNFIVLALLYALGVVGGFIVDILGITGM